MSGDLNESLTGRIVPSSVPNANTPPQRLMSPTSPPVVSPHDYCCVSACWTKLCRFWQHDDPESPRSAQMEPQYQAPVVTPPLRRTAQEEQHGDNEQRRLLPKWSEQSAPLREEAGGAPSHSSPSQQHALAPSGGSLNMTSTAGSLASKSQHRHTGSGGGDLVKQLSSLGGRTSPALSGARHHKVPSFSQSESASKGAVSNAARVAVLDDNDDHFCSTCLEPYTEENPKTFTACGHHYHLPCLYEWLERKETCPMCEAPLQFPGLD